jgi:DNA (cytosine-5)-methyltransferase 1
MLKLLDLFSGIGGFSLGLESTGGFETIAFVEKDDFCQKVLKKHWPNITIEGDIRNVKGDKYEADVITGGFPCQPFSVAGKRKGTYDDRYLWDETIRVVRECKPRWFIGENVEGLININNGVVLRQVQTDLEKEGFEVQCIIIPASGIGAWHQRKRIWIMAYSNSNGHRNKIGRSNGEKEEIQNQHRQNDSTSRKSSGTSSIRETSIEYVSNSDPRFSIGKNEEIQTGRTSINNGGEDVSNPNGNRKKWNKSKDGKRWWFESFNNSKDVSNSESVSSNDGRYGDDSKEKQIQLKAGRKDSNGYVSNSDSERLEGHRNKQQLQENGREKHSIGNSNDETKESWWQTQSRICGVPNGVSFELDKGRNNRIKSLGNSIVPQIVRQLGFAILEAEK